MFLHHETKACRCTIKQDPSTCSQPTNSTLKITFYSVLLFCSVFSIFFILDTTYNQNTFPSSSRVLIFSLRLFSTHGGTSEEKQREMRLKVWSHSHLPVFGTMSITMEIMKMCYSTCDCSLLEETLVTIVLENQHFILPYYWDSKLSFSATARSCCYAFQILVCCKGLFSVCTS